MLVAAVYVILAFMVILLVWTLTFRPTPWTKKPGKLGELIYATKDEVDESDWLVCLGSKLGSDLVRCIKTPDHFIYPPYDRPAKWFFDENTRDIIINNIRIPFSLARDTRLQCWSTSFKDKEVSKEEFDSYLETLAKIEN